jgi:hypothetical protein
VAAVIMIWYDDDDYDYEEEDDVENTGDEERRPIIKSVLDTQLPAQSHSSEHVEQMNKQRKLIQAVYGLNFASMVSCGSLLLSLGAYILVMNTNSSQYYIPFVFLFSGELLIFIILYNIAKMIVSSMKNRQQTATSSSRDWLTSNENKAALAIFAVQMWFAAVLWHVLVSISIFLLLLGVLGVVNVVYCTIPLLLLLSGVLVLALFTK